MDLNINNHIALTSCHDIKQLADSLFNKLYNINYFGFHQFYPDGGRIRLCSHFDWTKQYFIKQYYKKDYENIKISRTRKSLETNYILCDHWPKNYDLPTFSIIKDMQNTYNIAYHGLTVFKIYKEYSQVFCFSTIKENSDINNIYINNINIIEEFIAGFLFKATPIIKKAEQCKIYFPKRQNELNVDSYSQSFKHTDEHDNLSRKIAIKNNNKTIYLRKREIECLYYIYKGKTCKQIARELNLSPRTIEFYVENLKKRTGYQNYYQIIEEILRYNNKLDTILNP